MSTAEAPPLASPAVDHTLYRDGEVRRLSGTFGAWTVVCDEVTRLKQRLCSLRTVVQAPTGVGIALLTVSTGEDGRPAAMMRIPATWMAGTWVDIQPRQVQPVAPPPSPPAATNPATTGSLPTGKSGSTGKTGAPQAKSAEPAKPKIPMMRLRPVGCDGRTCTLVWSLPPAHIAALNTGAGLAVRYDRSPETGEQPLATAIGRSAAVAVTGVADAGGFAQAVSAGINAGR